MDMDEHTPDTTLNHIISQNMPELLNSSNSGIYYDDELRWILVLWPMVLPKLLANTTYRDLTTHPSAR
jgi:hypothetical protein